MKTHLQVWTIWRRQPGKQATMQWRWPNPKRKRLMPWLPSSFWLGTIFFLLFFMAKISQSWANPCVNECRWGRLGADGVADLLRPLLDSGDVCKDYASRVAGSTALAECGHVDIADAVAACSFGTAEAPEHCTRHKPVVIAVLIVSHVASIAVWFPLARMFVVSAKNRTWG